MVGFKLWALVLVASLLLVVACTPTPTAPAGGGAFIGGTQGVVASFEPLSVKDPESGFYTIYDTEDFSLDILLKNKGEEVVPIGKATARLLGPPPTLFQNLPNWQLLNKQAIDKISEFNPEGGEEIISFTTAGARAKYTGPVTGFTDITWNLEHWYDYKTHLIINDVCFKGDITEKKVCEVKEAKSFSVSGAPLTISKVEEDVAGKGIMLLKIDIKDAGTGQSTIPGQEFDTRFDQVHYSVDEPAKWECKSGGRENEARLTDGLATINCRLKQPLAENDLYTKQVRLTFDYTYKDLVQEKLRIKESVK